MKLIIFLIFFYFTQSLLATDKYFDIYVDSSNHWNSNISSISHPDKIKIDLEFCHNFNPDTFRTIISFIKKECNVKELRISCDNESLRLASNLQDLSNLEVLIVEAKLEKLPNLNKLNRLKRIKFYSLDTLSHELDNCLNLESLEIEKIKSFYPAICSLRKLTFLKLGGDFDNIPKEINQLIKLDTLVLEDTYIKSLPNTISEIESLRFINLFNTLFNEEQNQKIKLNHYCNLIWGSLRLNNRIVKENDIFKPEELKKLDSITCSNKNLTFIDNYICIAGFDVVKKSQLPKLTTEQRNVIKGFVETYEKNKDKFKARLFARIDVTDKFKNIFTIEKRIYISD